MGRSPCCEKEGLKKGPWTQEEDQKLITFITEHGHGNWRSLPKNCGLLRCGKSCRLRWKNYLRPDIKRGIFTASEEQTILQLHALVGNKWAFIASQLPKRTDNEIKNYWNTVLKKRLHRVGTLPPFPTATTTGATTRITLSATEGRSGEDKSLCKSGGAQTKKPSQTIISSPAATGMDCSHLAQWESARLEAEARLAKEAISKRAHKLNPFEYTRLSFSTTSVAATCTTTSAIAPPPTTTASDLAALSSFLFFDETSPTTTASAVPSFPTTNSTACSTALSSSFSIATSALSAIPSLSSSLQPALRQQAAGCLSKLLKSTASTDSEPYSLLHQTSTNNYVSDPTPSFILPPNNPPSETLPSSFYLSTTSCLSLPSTSFPATSSLTLPSTSFPAIPSLSSPVVSASTLSSLSSLSTAASLMLPINSLSNTSSLFSPVSLSLPDNVRVPSSSSASNNSSKSSKSTSSKASAELSSEKTEKTILSVLRLGPRLSWLANSPVPASDTSQALILGEMLCKNINEQGVQTVRQCSASESKGNPGFSDKFAEGADLEQKTYLEAASSTMSTGMVNSFDSWHDLLFSVENSCSDVVSSN